MKKRRKPNLVRVRAENLKPPSEAEIQRMLAIRAEDIDYSDIPERNFRSMKRFRAMPISIRLEKELLDWFRKGGPGYQTRIRRALREFMESHKYGKSQVEQIADAIVRKLQQKKPRRKSRSADAQRPVDKRAA